MSNAPITTASSGEPKRGDRIGEYVVEEHLARGGMATVLGVRHHTLKGEPLALKLLHPLSMTDDAQGRFRREFRALSKLQHPNVLRVYEWGLLGSRPWFTMERLEGHDLRAEVEAMAQMPARARFERAEDILTQVARALAYVHERGLVHRDITPGNIFIVRSGVVKLMDFGVVKEAGAELTAVGELLGTVAYMAPEQITGGGIDARADLYALGAVLYLLLTGRRAFQAHTIHGFMEKHLNAQPRPPGELVPEVPTRLEEVCLRLLEKDPRDRFASASHLLHVLGAIDQSSSFEGAFPGRTVGRTLLKAQLSEAVEQVSNRRRGRVVLLTGPSGQGKTRMLDHAEHHARRLGVKVAFGRCRHHDRPFGAFVSIYRSLRADEPSDLLEEVFRSDDDSERVWERYPILNAFRELVAANSPLLIVIDDLDRADPATVELLTFLARNTLELAELPVLFLLGHDSEGNQIRTQLSGLAALETFELQPLDASEVEELVVSLLGSTPDSHALATRLHTEGNGSPALIADMLRGLLDEGLIVKDDRLDRYQLSADRSQIHESRLPMPASLRQSLQERLAPLSDPAVEVGRLLAHARITLDLDVLVAVSPLNEEEVIAALDELVDAGIVHELRSEEIDRFELSHSRFREVLLDRVSAKTVRELNQTLGEALERQHRGQTDAIVAELAYHFEQARLAPKAYQYLVRTAQRHLHRSLNEEALGFLDRAVALEPAARPYMLLDDADHRLAEVYLAMAQAKHALGHLPEAVVATQRAQELAKAVRDPGLQSRVASELATQLRQHGATELAEEQARLAIKRANEVGDQRLLPTPLYELGGILWSHGDLEGAESLWRQSLQIAKQLGDERAEGQGYNGLAILAVCRGESMEARRSFEQSARLFERLGMLEMLVVARVNLIELYSDTGLLRKALALSDRTVAQANEVRHPRGTTLGKAWRARTLLLLGRMEEAQRDALDASALSEHVRSREDEAFVLGTLVLLRAAQQDWEATLVELDRLLGVLEIHDKERIHAEAAAWKTWVLSQLGRPAEAREVFEDIAQPAGLWPHVQIRADLAVGRALRSLERQPEARGKLQRALSASEANGYRYLQLCAHRELVAVTDDPASRDRHARVASGLARSLAANLPREDAERFLVVHDQRASPA